MKEKHEDFSHEDIVSGALNEQGFLFSHIIREKITRGFPGKGRPQTEWSFVGSEYPVTATDGSQTRIDMVFRHSISKGVYLCLECKRPNPLYKQWIFFDKEITPEGSGQYLFESFYTSMRPLSEKSLTYYHVDGLNKKSPCETFNLYLEAALARDKKVSHTQTIEDAFLQAIKGQKGLLTKQLDFDDAFRVYSVPVVVTTAKLFEARYDIKKSCLESATLKAKDVKLQPLDFCAVNYHPNDNLSRKSEFGPRKPRSIEEDMTSHLTRTVFVVHGGAILKFLEWSHENLVRKIS